MTYSVFDQAWKSAWPDHNAFSDLDAWRLEVRRIERDMLGGMSPAFRAAWHCFRQLQDFRDFTLMWWNHLEADVKDEIFEAVVQRLNQEMKRKKENQ